MEQYTNENLTLESIYTSIESNGFTYYTLEKIDQYTQEILNGKTNLIQFNQQEHAGLCCAGEVLIGAYIVCNYARKCLEASSDTSTSERIPSNWEIDELQEKLVQQWAEAKQIWFANAEGINYKSDRLSLEDMHPANVFIDTISDKAICIDCIVKFIRK